MKYLVIIPTFNEINTIGLLIDKILKINNVDLLIIDDNSPDGTSHEVKKINNSRINIINRKKKLGLGSAYIEGFKYAICKKYDFVIQIDADLSHNPEDISRLISYSRNNDLVIGSRYIKGISIVNWPLSRLFLSYFANLYSRVITGMPIKDTTGGFKCISTNILKNINLDKIKSEGYSFQIEINYLSWIKKYKITEIPIVFTDRATGTSKMSKKIIFEALYMVPLLKFRKILKIINK